LFGVPSQRNPVAVQEYLSERRMTAVNLLSLAGDPTVPWKIIPYRTGTMKGLLGLLLDQSV